MSEFAAKAHEWFLAQGGTRGWVCMEHNDFNNAARSTAVKQAVEANGDVFTIWMTRPFTAAQARQACVESGASGFSAEAEIPSEDENGPKPEAQNWPELIHELDDLPIPKSVMTNFAPFVHHDNTPWPEKAKPLIDAGWNCLTECYDIEGEPEFWPERRDFYAKQLGWSETQPGLGLYAGRNLGDFPSRHEYRNWWAWSAESVL